MRSPCDYFTVTEGLYTRRTTDSKQKVNRCDPDYTPDAVLPQLVGRNTSAISAGGVTSSWS